jgi:hypothetical protein
MKWIVCRLTKTSPVSFNREATPPIWVRPSANARLAGWLLRLERLARQKVNEHRRRYNPGSGASIDASNSGLMLETRLPVRDCYPERLQLLPVAWLYFIRSGHSAEAADAWGSDGCSKPFVLLAEPEQEKSTINIPTLS